jgi:hypothetical protein
MLWQASICCAARGNFVSGISLELKEEFAMGLPLGVIAGMSRTRAGNFSAV